MIIQIPTFIRNWLLSWFCREKPYFDPAGKNLDWTSNYEREYAGVEQLYRLKLKNGKRFAGIASEIYQETDFLFAHSQLFVDVINLPTAIHLLPH